MCKHPSYLAKKHNVSKVQRNTYLPRFSFLKNLSLKMELIRVHLFWEDFRMLEIEVLSSQPIIRIRVGKFAKAIKGRGKLKLKSRQKSV